MSSTSSTTGGASAAAVVPDADDYRRQMLIDDAKRKMAALDEPVRHGDSWSDLLRKLKRAGWDIGWYGHCLPGGNRRGKPGIDFLGSPALVQQFAVEHFGWGGALHKRRLEQIGIGSRVGIFWKEDRTYYPATIIAKHRRRNTYTYLYDDGTQETYDLSDQLFEVLDDAVPEAARAAIDAALRTGGDDDDDDGSDDAVTEAARAVIAAARSGDGDADGSSTMTAGLTRRPSPRRSGSYTSEQGSEDEFESVANKGNVDGSATMAAGLTRRISSTASSATKKRSATKAAVGASSTKKSKTKALPRKSVTPKEAKNKVSAPKQSDIRANSPCFASFGNQEFDHSVIQGSTSGSSGSTAPKRKPSVDEMLLLLQCFGPPAGKKTRTKTAYSKTPSAVRSCFSRWFPDFYHRFRYNEAEKCWVPRHHNGSVIMERRYRRTNPSPAQTEVRDDKVCTAATGPSRAAGVPPAAAAAYQSAVGLGGGTKPPATALAADKFLADLMAGDDSKEASAAEPGGAGSKIEREDHEGDLSPSKPLLQKEKIMKRVVSPSAPRDSEDEVETLAAKDLSLEEIERFYLQKKREREDAIAAAESLPLPVLEEICQKKKLKLSTIDLTTEDTGVVESDGSGMALQNMAKAAARLISVKKEKDDAQEKLAAARDDAEIFEETVLQQTMTTEIWQERFKEVFKLALEAGADGKTLSSIRDRPLTNGH